MTTVTTTINDNRNFKTNSNLLSEAVQHFVFAKFDMPEGKTLKQSNNVMIKNMISAYLVS